MSNKTTSNILEHLAIQATKESILMKMGECNDHQLNRICEALSILRFWREEIKAITVDNYNGHVREAAAAWISVCSNKIALLDQWARKTLSVSIIALEETIQCQLACSLKRVIGSK